MNKDDAECYDKLIEKINMLQNTLTKLKSRLKTVYTMCDTAFCEEKNAPDTKDTNNERR